MRINRLPQASIFERYSEHEFGQTLSDLSKALDSLPELIDIVAQDFIADDKQAVGRIGMTVESILRCLILKQHLKISFDMMAFHLSDSMTYQSFARLRPNQSPRRSSLHNVLRQVKSETLMKINHAVTSKLYEMKLISLESIRIDSTVIKSNIAAPVDSQLLNDGIRVLCRMMSNCEEKTNTSIIFDDVRKSSKSLAFKIFNAKNAIKKMLYPELIELAKATIKQAKTALSLVNKQHNNQTKVRSTKKWMSQFEEYIELTLKVINQTDRRILKGEKVPSSEKVVSIFEPHTDIIIKGKREVLFGHKVNLSTDQNGFITYFSIEEGSPCDTDLYLPVINAHEKVYLKVPCSVAADGGYSCKVNVQEARNKGVTHAMFYKTNGINLSDMGLKQITFDKLKKFRAGVEANISELKRAYGAGKALWKGEEGFKAYSWTSVVSYNLFRFAKMLPD